VTSTNAMPPRITARAASSAAAGSEARITETRRCARTASNTSRAFALASGLISGVGVGMGIDLSVGRAGRQP
jgi:F0F1-type ATP synthase assembly protein I